MCEIDLATKFSRLFVQTQDEDRFKRKNALEFIKNEASMYEPSEENDLLICKKVINNIFDSGERNRELACDILDRILKRQKKGYFENFLPIIIPELSKKLGDKDNIESCEEIRMALMNILFYTVCQSGKAVSLFMPELLGICCVTLMDSYAEIKRVSCYVATELSMLSDYSFHSLSELLVKPLTGNMCHQHSKVRVDTINCFGNVLLSGSVKSFDSICGSLAQRLFDDNPSVRRSVVEVFGKWLLDLPDRYSFHPKLMPVFLTGFIDEMDDIRELTADLWHDIGMKFQQENEADLKEQIDFEEPNLPHYPKKYDRPNLGCRTLMFRYVSRILPPITRDLADWSEQTRLKAAQLLPWLLLNTEFACTQHCQILLGATLIRGLVDEDAAVRAACRESCSLLGYFVKPKVWWNVLSGLVRRCDTDEHFLAGQLVVLGCVVSTCRPLDLLDDAVDSSTSVLHQIVDYLQSDSVMGSLSVRIKYAGLQCLINITQVVDHDHTQLYESELGLCMFYAGLSFASLETDHDEAGLNNQLQTLLIALQTLLHEADVTALFQRFLAPSLERLLDGPAAAMPHLSVERALCCRLLRDSGVALGHVVQPCLRLLEVCLQRDRPLELRLKFFMVLVQLLSDLDSNLNSQNKFGAAELQRLLDAVVLPNLVWQAGRSAEALRRIGCACLWGLLVGCSRSDTAGGLNRLSDGVWKDLLARLLGLLDDDCSETRLIACRGLVVSLDLITRHELLLAAVSVNRDQIHDMYPQLLKRMDDSRDDIRITAAKAVQSWTEVIRSDVADDSGCGGVYRARMEALITGLLVHLDDSEPTVQSAVYGSLHRLGELCPALATAELHRVRMRHRSPVLCDRLLHHIDPTYQQRL